MNKIMAALSCLCSLLACSPAFSSSSHSCEELMKIIENNKENGATYKVNMGLSEISVCLQKRDFRIGYVTTINDKTMTPNDLRYFRDRKTNYLLQLSRKENESFLGYYETRVLLEFQQLHVTDYIRVFKYNHGL